VDTGDPEDSLWSDPRADEPPRESLVENAMIDDTNYWFIKSRPTIYGGIWLIWFLSPLVVTANLQSLYSVSWVPAEVTRAVCILYALAWPLGVFALSILVIVGLKVAPGVSADACKAQAEYERRQRSSSKSEVHPSSIQSDAD
jgi:hypothetical protein